MHHRFFQTGPLYPSRLKKSQPERSSIDSKILKERCTTNVAFYPATSSQNTRRINIIHHQIPIENFRPGLPSLALMFPCVPWCHLCKVFPQTAAGIVCERGEACALRSPRCHRAANPHQLLKGRSCLRLLFYELSHEIE